MLICLCAFFAGLVWYVTDEYLRWFRIWEPLPVVLAVLTFALSTAVALFARGHVVTLHPVVRGVAAVVALGVAAFVVYISIAILDLASDSALVPWVLGLGWGLVAFCLIASAVAHWVGVLQAVVVGGAGIAIGFAAARVLQPDAVLLPGVGRGEPPPPVSDWAVGDVHVHAAGDRSLTGHPDCRSPEDPAAFLPPQECAPELVRLTLEAARDNEADWVVLVEHGAWLGLRSFTDYEFDEGVRQWESLKDAASELAPEFGVRALMGEELGTAGAGFAGHYSAYQIDDYVLNSHRRVPDVDYVAGVDRERGWGAINHPLQGGNVWDCWYPTDGPRCGAGATGFAERVGTVRERAAFRALEITNGGDFPDPETLALWDKLLVQGYKVWPVGGSDAHTRSRTTNSLVHFTTGQPNIAKILRSRTFAYMGETDVTPPEGFDSTAPDDPIRRALYAGRVVASNGPFAAATVNGSLPGDSVPIAGSGDVQLTLTIRWARPFSSTEDDPTEIRVVVTDIDRACTSACQPDLVETVIPVEGRSEHVLQLTYPESMGTGYVRVEVLGRAGDRELGAFVSPIFLIRSEG